ncbi:hypothetical protein Aduo_005460 [Ancylostoma duodenale]
MIPQIALHILKNKSGLNETNSAARFNHFNWFIATMRFAATTKPAVILVFAATTFSLDSAAFHRIFNNSALTQQEIEQLAKEYNYGVESGRGKEAGVDYLKSLGANKQQKSIISKFLDVWKKDLMLRNLHGAVVKSIRNDISKDLKAKIPDWKQEADKKYKGDFSKSQLEVVRRIENEVPKAQKEATKTKLNQPLQAFKAQKEMEKLLAALTTFKDHQ